ncbi:acetyl-CoA carboxylase biotin carboxyl carrier protein [Clostridium sp. 'White wine YQ']|uniref:acetyl-CoA carboxylase biotin carboxyl carrier protein n=1 Tax=Clostridium sp. 'White wine YQ' TaxID=3027474 RepID=UPI0023669BE2|nr:acetyl-CoA carboxylase biotin carboxyl carrier protein [Clostridium sp. 'White wine YQ']MDD7793281.1 acetyl-CoA carboxylase biotin carboxyl carrier protein [Clostridium sp. 'White wine YQ']
MKIEEVKELINLINESDLALFEFKTDDCYLKMDKSTTRSSEVKEVVTAASPVPVANITSSETTIVNKEETIISAPAQEGYIVKSPIVGTFYMSPSPDKPAYAEVGKRVKQGDTLCIIEAMKLMNEIESEVSGEVLEILVENESMVEFGQPLFRIRRD